MFAGHRIGADDDTIVFGGHCVVKIPDGVGRFSVTSTCGGWAGEIIIQERGGYRYLTYMRMTQPASIAMRVAKGE